MKRCDYKDITKRINEVKRTIGNNIVSLTELTELFKQNNLPTHNMFIYAFIKKCMVKVSRGKYRFRSSNPIYYKVIENIYVQRDRTLKTQSVEIINKEEEAIQYLKSLGYRIFKVIQTLEEV